MKKTLEKLSNIKSEVCITLILRTHQTHPENQQDSLLLKNQITEAERRLKKEYNENTARQLIQKLEKLAEEIDHRYNDKGLILFVNEDIAKYLRVSVHPTNRVILDNTFATRTIIRALKKNTDYYTLILSKGKARLIKASSDEVLEEYTDKGFPFEDKELLKVAKPESTKSARVTNLTQEFFNRVDKKVNAIRKEDPFSVVIYSEEINYHSYLKVADHPNTILGHILLKNFDEKAENLIKKEVWPHVMELAVSKNRKRISELEKALSTGNYLGDINEIWTALQEGRGNTIFVEEGYYQPVKEENGHFTAIKPEEISSKTDNNDIIDDMIEQCLKFGGDVVFLEKDSLKDFNKVALATRY